MTDETLVEKTLRERLERERDLLTDLAHKVVKLVQKGVRKRWFSANVEISEETAKILRQSKTGTDFFLLALEANGINREWVLIGRDVQSVPYVSVDLKSLPDLPFNDN